MHHSNFKNVVFDLGGVLIDWNPRYVYRQICKREEEMEYFLTNICNRDWDAQQDAGRPFAEGIRTLNEQYPEHAHLINIYHQRWHEMLKGEISATVAILEKLKHSRINLYALTNWSHETFPYALKTCPCLQHFLDIVVSGKEKVIKPDKKIFEILLTRNNLKATESVFIDDNLPNVNAAKALGFVGIHFTSPQKLHLELKEMGCDSTTDVT